MKTKTLQHDHYARKNFRLELRMCIRRVFDKKEINRMTKCQAIIHLCHTYEFLDSVRYSELIDRLRG